MKTTQSAFGLIAFAGILAASFAQTPTYSLIDKDADARTNRVFDYLKSQYGKKMLSGCWTESQYGGAQAFHTCSGEWPAIWGQDMNSWYASRTDQLWISTWNGNINGFKTAWSRGEIPQVNWHWQMVSSKVNGAYTRDAWGKNSGGSQQMMTDQQWSDIVTPGTVLYTAMIDDVDYHITNFLKKLVDANGPLPILFRPLHEIDGGWFWWTCTSDPAKTAMLYKIIQDRVMNYHKMHNLIWIYNPGVLCNGGTWPPYQAAEVTRRKLYYPGDTYCDMAGIDLYDWDWKVTGTYTPAGGGAKTYRDAWNVMKAITSTKMVALSECQGFPDPAKCFTDPTFAPWSYALPWYSDEANGVPCDILTARVNNSYMINASDLPDFSKATSVSAPVRAIPQRPTVLRSDGRLVISGLGQGMHDVNIVNSRGTVIMPAFTCRDRREMSTQGLADGAYFLVLTSDHGTTTVPVVVGK